MGTTMPPALASIVIAYHEKNYLESLQQRPLLWRRYIDDVLAIWPYTKVDFENFFHNLNLINPDLRFTLEILYTSVNFLDLTISKGLTFLRTGLLSTSIYFKHTNTFSYLYGDSFIAKHVLKGIALDEIIWTLRNTSCPKYFRLIKRILIKQFYRRGFPRKAVQAAKKICFGSRDYYLERSKRGYVIHPIPVRTKFYNYSPSVGIIFDRLGRGCWMILYCHNIFPHLPSPFGRITLI